MSKHGWNSLSDYIPIHEKVLRIYQKYMEIPRTYDYKINSELDHKLTCSRLILNTYRGTRVRIDISKGIVINLSNPNRPLARTFDYTYNANIAGGQKLFRYCSPHDDSHEERSAPHHKYHHKHDFTKNPKGEVTLLGNDEWPHVGEFFEEVLSRF